jgi:hypothetical protein
MQEDAAVKQPIFPADEEVFIAIHDGCQARVAIWMTIDYVRASISVAQYEFVAIDVLRW